MAQAPPERRLPLVALVLEPLSNLGQAVVQRLASEGACLVMLGHAHERDQLEALGRKCACIGAPAVDIHAMEGPLHDQAVVHRLARVVLSRQGGLDVVMCLPPSSPAASADEPWGSGEQSGAELRQTAAGGLLHRLLPHHARQSPAAPATDQATWLRHLVDEMMPELAPLDHRAGGALQQAEPPGSKLYIITVQGTDASGGGGHGPSLTTWAQEMAKNAGPRAAVLTILLPHSESQLPPSAVAEVVLLPWREELAPGIHHQVLIQDVQTKELSSREGHHTACWMQLSTVQGPPKAAASSEAAAARLLAACYCAPASPPRPPVLSVGAHDDLQAPELGDNPSVGATRRCSDRSKATWIVARSITGSCGGIEEVTGKRQAPGLLTRPAAPGELGLGKQDRSGAVLAPADPQNLEPDIIPDQYQDQPMRNPLMMVHCFAPFNAESPHNVLSKEFLTPSDLFYVRNHLPVPACSTPEDFRLTVTGLGLGGRSLELSLAELKAGAAGATVHRQATLQCAGNRRNEMAAVKLVEGRAPWNHGGIGNALWTGVNMRDALGAAGLDLLGSAAGSSGVDKPRHVILKGMDWHRETNMHYTVSIPLEKVLDPRGGVMLAWAMNGEPLPADHGFPLRAIVPGYVGARSVKWLQSIELSAHEAEAPWQKVDYKLMPHAYHTVHQWMLDARVMPPIMAMPVQSAILEPEPGSVVRSGTEAIFVRGYAWSGNGVPIIRVDVSADDGTSWVQADLVEGPGITDMEGTDDGGMAWAWTKFEVPLEVPEALRHTGGKWRLAVKAINRNCDSQPDSVAAVWNFRGLANNAWHTVPLFVEPPAAGG